VVGFLEASFLFGERAPAACGDIHAAQVGFHSGGGAGNRVGFGGNTRDLTPGVLTVLLPLPPRSIEMDTQQHILVKRFRNVSSDQKVLDLVTQTTAKGGYLGFLIPVQNCHVADESGVV
jgi:hypothetical protein